MTAEREGLAEIAGALAEHVRGDWSDRTYSCGGCANRFERETQAAWEAATTEERRAHHAELIAHQKPNWSLADYNAHVAEALADLLAARDQRAEAWDEGWQKGQLWAFSDLDEYGKHTNPHRIEVGA